MFVRNAGFEMKKIYLDYAATTPVRPEVIDAMTRVMQEVSGNPSSIYTTGRLAGFRLTRARDAVAAGLGVPGSELIFTSGGTEADNLALKGLALANLHTGRHIITSRVEHKAVLASCEWLTALGFEITYLPTDPYGLVAPESLREALRPDTILVSLIWVNNELGSINPILALGEIAHEQGVIFHTDAVQAFGKISIDPANLPVDALSLSAHKISGPKGVGALWLRKGINLKPLVGGGTQENNLRGGTENLAGIIGFGKAVELMSAEFDETTQRENTLLGELEARLQNIPGIRVNTPPLNRAPNILNVSVPDVDGESLFMNLDIAGVEVSNGSACTSGAQQPSTVLTAIGLPKDLAQSTLRVSLGRETTREELYSFVDILTREVHKLKKTRKAGA